MAIDYTGTLGLAKLATGENYGTWGVLENTNWNIVEQAMSGNLTVDITSGDVTLTRVAGSLTSQVCNYTIVVTGTGITPASARKLNVPVGTNKAFYVVNNASGPITVKATAGVGAGSAVVWIPNGMAKTVAVVTDSTGTTNVYDQGMSTPGRNYIDNGGMYIDQRGGHGSFTISAGVTAITADRWSVYSVDGQTFGNVTADASLAGNSYVLTIVPQTGTTSTQVAQRLSSIDTVGLTGLTVTLSFWVYTSGLSGTSSYVQPFSPTVTDNFSALTYGASQPIAYTNGAWVKNTFTFSSSNGGMDPGHGFGVLFNIISAVGATIKITGVKLEQGTVATPFVQEPYATALAICQRDYEVGRMDMQNVGDAGDSHVTSVMFKVTKRVQPIVTTGVISLSNAPIYGAYTDGVDNMSWYCTQAAKGGFQWHGTWVAATGF